MAIGQKTRLSPIAILAERGGRRAPSERDAIRESAIIEASHKGFSRAIALTGVMRGGSGSPDRAQLDHAPLKRPRSGR